MLLHPSVIILPTESQNHRSVQLILDQEGFEDRVLVQDNRAWLSRQSSTQCLKFP